MIAAVTSYTPNSGGWSVCFIKDSYDPDSTHKQFQDDIQPSYMMEITVYCFGDENTS